MSRNSLSIPELVAPTGDRTQRVHNEIAKMAMNKQRLRSLYLWEMFRQLCPKWFKWIMEDGFEGAYRKHIRSLESPKTCIVGELHGGKDDYMLMGRMTCIICEGFACDTLMDYEGANWAMAIPRLMQHWQDKHLP